MALMTDDEIEDLRLNFREFLRGELWGLQVDDFLEMNCIYFEPNSANNSQEHRNIWNSYKELINQQLDYFLEVFGVTNTNLKSALQSRSSSTTIDSDKLYQVLAGENTEQGFSVFVNMMITKRLVLDRLTAQVLNELARKEERISKALSLSGDDKTLEGATSSKTDYYDSQDAIDRVLKESENDVRMPDFSSQHRLSPNSAAQAHSKFPFEPLDIKPESAKLSDLSLAPPIVPSPAKSSSANKKAVTAPPIFMEREASTLMVENLRKEEEKAKTHLQSNPFAIAKAPPLSPPKADSDNSKDFLSAQIRRANFGSKATAEFCSASELPEMESVKASSSVAKEFSEEDKSKRFLDLRKQLLDKKAKMRDQQADKLNVPENRRPVSARKGRGADASSADVTHATNSSSTSVDDPSRARIRKNIMASVRDEIMER